MKISDVRGFNYSGSWGTSGLDLWQHHDNDLMNVEVSRGKSFFPGWNVARWWLSHEGFQRDPQRFLANFETGLAIFARNGILVMPVLFNRWRDPVCDFGGVPLDHIIPDTSNYVLPKSFVGIDQPDEEPWSIHRLFRNYLDAVVGTHAEDERIIAWDLCNEPLMGPYVNDPQSSIRLGELRWLGWCRDVCKAIGARQPLTIGNYPNITAIEITEPLMDVISFHPYYIPNYRPDRPQLAQVGTKEGYENFLDEIVALAKKSGKELIASETVWGAVEDADHVAIAEYTLSALVKRKIGFTVHALHHSLVADLHAAQYGPVGWPGRLEFINADGSLRVGHEVFNKFASID